MRFSQQSVRGLKCLKWGKKRKLINSAAEQTGGQLTNKCNAEKEMFVANSFLRRIVNALQRAKEQDHWTQGV